MKLFEKEKKIDDNQTIFLEKKRKYLFLNIILNKLED